MDAIDEMLGLEDGASSEEDNVRNAIESKASNIRQRENEDVSFLSTDPRSFLPCRSYDCALDKLMNACRATNTSVDN